MTHFYCIQLSAYKVVFLILVHVQKTTKSSCYFNKTVTYPEYVCLRVTKCFLIFLLIHFYTYIHSPYTPSPKSNWVKRLVMTMQKWH